MSTCIVLISAHERDDLADVMMDTRAVRFLRQSARGAAAIAGSLSSAPESPRVEDTTVDVTTTRLLKQSRR